MNKKSIGLIVSLVFALATAGGFYWLWTTSKADVSGTPIATTSTYTVVEIESVKKEAVDILSGLENKASIPIPTPTEKMGRVNPYVNY
jgi:hypothetical protein